LDEGTKKNNKTADPKEKLSEFTEKEKFLIKYVIIIIIPAAITGVGILIYFSILVFQSENLIMKLLWFGLFGSLIFLKTVDSIKKRTNTNKD
jgi:hypothetical protein